MSEQSIAPVTPINAGKSFRIKRTGKEPHEFKLELEQADGSITEEVFHARPSVPGELLLDVTAAGAAGQEYQAAALRRFFTEAIVPEDRERWQQVLANSDPPVDIEELADIVSWLVERYGKNPTRGA